MGHICSSTSRPTAARSLTSGFSGPSCCSSVMRIIPRVVLRLALAGLLVDADQQVAGVGEQVAVVLGVGGREAVDVIHEDDAALAGADDVPARPARIHPRLSLDRAGSREKCWARVHVHVAHGLDGATPLLALGDDVAHRDTLGRVLDGRRERRACQQQDGGRQGVGAW